MAQQPSIVLLFVFCCTLVHPILMTATGEQDGRSVSDGWLKFKKAIGGLKDQATLISERQAYQDPQRHYARPHVMSAPAKRARPGYRGPATSASHPPRSAMFGGFKPMSGIPMRPWQHPMPVKPALNQHLNQQPYRMAQQHQQHQQPQQPPQPQKHQQHYVQQQQQQQQQQPNQQASPKIRTVAGRPEHPQPQPSQQQQQQQQFPYPIELIDLPPPPVPPHSLAQEELLKLQFTSDEYLMYLYSDSPAIKEPEQDIQAAQSAPNQVTTQDQQLQQGQEQQKEEQPLQPPVNPSAAIFDPYRYNSVHSWEKKDKESAEEDWNPIPSPWGDETARITNRDTSP